MVFKKKKTTATEESPEIEAKDSKEMTEEEIQRENALRNILGEQGYLQVYYTKQIWVELQEIVEVLKKLGLALNNIGELMEERGNE